MNDPVAEIMRLAALWANARELSQGAAQAAAAYDALESFARSVVKDAERYRFLRDERSFKGWERFEFGWVQFVPVVSHEKQTLDTAIDASLETPSAEDGD